MIPNSLAAWLDFVAAHDHASPGVRRAISQLVRDHAATAPTIYERSYLTALSDSIVNSSPARVERPREIQ